MEHNAFNFSKAKFFWSSFQCVKGSWEAQKTHKGTEPVSTESQFRHRFGKNKSNTARPIVVNSITLRLILRRVKIMNIVRVTKSFNFETAHALYGYDGKCKNIHGHSYKLFVTIKGVPIQDVSNPKFGMVIDFGDIKKIVKSEVIDLFDHTILLNVNSPHKELGESLAKEGHQVIFTEYQPSCENMLIDMVARLQPHFQGSAELQSIRLHETETSYAEWLAEDNQ